MPWAPPLPEEAPGVTRGLCYLRHREPAGPAQPPARITVGASLSLKQKEVWPEMDTPTPVSNKAMASHRPVEELEALASAWALLASWQRVSPTKRKGDPDPLGKPGRLWGLGTVHLEEGPAVVPVSGLPGAGARTYTCPQEEEAGCPSETLEGAPDWYLGGREERETSSVHAGQYSSNHLWNWISPSNGSSHRPGQ